MSGRGAGAGGDAELGHGDENKEDGIEQEEFKNDQMELDSVRAFMEEGLHNMFGQMQGMLEDVVVPGDAVEGGVVQQDVPLEGAAAPCGPIGGVAVLGELPCGTTPLAVAGPGSTAETVDRIACGRTSQTGAKRQEM